MFVTPKPLRLLAIFVVAALALISVTASQSQPLTEVTVGIGLTKPPYVLESGKEGLEVDLARAALTAGGYSMVPVQYPPTRGLALFRSRKLDGLLTVDEGIGGNDYFSDPYIIYQNVATTLANQDIRLDSIEDLSKYSVGAFQNANAILGERFRAVVAHHPNYKEYPQQILQDKMLYTGRIDVAVGDKLIFHYFSKRLEPSIDTSQAVVYHAIFPPNPRKAVFVDVKVRDAFNAGLKLIKANGSYDAIVKKYQTYMAP